MNTKDILNFFNLSDESCLDKDYKYESLVNYENGKFISTDDEDADFIVGVLPSGRKTYFNRMYEPVVEGLIAKDTYGPVSYKDAKGIIIMHEDAYHHNYCFVSREYYYELYKISWYDKELYYDKSDAVFVDGEPIPSSLENTLTAICSFSGEKHLRKNMVSVYNKETWNPDCEFYDDFIPVYKELVEHSQEYVEVLFGFDNVAYGERTFLPIDIFKIAYKNEDIVRIGHSYVSYKYILERDYKRFVKDFFDTDKFVDTNDEYCISVRGVDGSIIGYTYSGQHYVVRDITMELFYYNEEQEAYLPDGI